MQSGDKFILTVRNRIKDEPRITKQLTYVNPFEMKMISSLDFLRAIEKDKKNTKLMKFYKEEMHKFSHKREKHEVFTDDTFVFKCLDKFVCTNEGFYNLKKITN